MFSGRSLRRRPADRRLAHCNPVRIPTSLQEAKLKTSLRWSLIYLLRRGGDSNPGYAVTRITG